VQHLAQGYGAFATGIQADALDGPVRRIVGLGFADCLAVLLCGAREDATLALLTALGDTESGPCSLLLGQRRAQPETAALINGTAAQALDYDDTGLEGHPSAVLVPAILAAAEEVGADGSAMLAGYVAGYEIWADLVERTTDRWHARGLHPTGYFGPLAAAAAAGRVYGLDGPRITHAIAIAASFSSGVVANFGAMMKPVQTGRAAEGGVRAARLARAGLTGAPDALDHPLGFLKAFGGANPPATGWAGMGRPGARLARIGLNFKLHAICYAANRLGDAGCALHAPVAQATDGSFAVRRIVARIGRDQSAPLRAHDPRTVLDARFSAQFAVAAGLIAGRIGLPEVSEPFLSRPEVRAAIRATEIQLTEERDADEPLFAPFDSVTVELDTGRILESPPIRHARGHFRNPPEERQLRAKARDCMAAAGFDARTSDTLFDLARHPERIIRAEELRQVLADAHAGNSSAI